MDMQYEFSRTQMLFGRDAIEKLKRAHVAVFGVGGVGGYAVEVLARSGVGKIDLFDNDCVSITNINRQIIALHSTLGRYKVDVAAERIHDINPDCIVTCHRLFYLPENADSVDLSQYDYLIDCIDTIKAKLELIRRCKQQNVPIISCMGAANKIDPTAFRVSDLSDTQKDPLARILRKTLRKEGIINLKVVYSEETPLRPVEQLPTNNQQECAEQTEEIPKSTTRRDIPASNAFVPAAAGLIIGGEVVKDIIAQPVQ